MTLLSELIDIPTEVHKSDFVISLKSAIEDPGRTIADYVVTPQLVECFDDALSLITSAVADHRSKASYLHASFGSGKSAFMAVTHLLLQGEPAARSKPELASVLHKYESKLAGRKFLLVPYQAVGANSLEQVVLGGYVEYVQRMHPDRGLPAVYVSDGIVDDSRTKRAELGDEAFFRVLSDGDAADEWGEYGSGWDAVRFEAALAAPPTSSERDQLVSALLRSHYRALPGQAQATAEGFVPIDDGLEAISRHAKGLGYDAVVLFLDELVLWLASRMSDVAFVSREGAKVVKLVEGDDHQRPAPIVSLIARQRDLRELVGDHVPGAQSLSAVDILRHSEGRFDTITLEDRNLPAIAEQRLLKPRSEAARQQLDEAFEQVKRQLAERGERDVLLSASGDLAEFRRLYPFSPALVDALVALSGAMQRERTSLKVMLHLLVANRDRLQVGQLVPLGDLFDAINTGDEPLTEVMRAQFQQARRVWSTRFEPMLLRIHGLTASEAEIADPDHPFVIDARLVKSLLVAALVPEVGPLRSLTVSRLTALNSGVVRAFIPGTERQQVLDKLRIWAAEIGELRLGDDDHDPTVSVHLQGIDTGPILDSASMVDNEGERRRRVRDLLAELLQVKDPDSFTPTLEVTWRGITRHVDVVFANVRSLDELPDESLRAGSNPKIVIDFPWDDESFSPNDDRARVEGFRRERPAEWTAVWLPNFLSSASRQQLGKLVRLDYVLTGDAFDRAAGHLSPTDRPIAKVQLTNEQAAVSERVRAILRQAYAVDQPQPGTVDPQLEPGEQFATLDAALRMRPPTGTSLRSYAEGIADQMFAFRYPKHPDFTEKLTAADLRNTYTQVVAALGERDGRLENVDPALRKVLNKVAGPLQLGTMHAAHFVADLQMWTDLIDRRRTETNTTTLTVRVLRSWLDGADTPSERRGLFGEVADLVIMCFAAATNRSFVEAGRPVSRPEIGRLGPDWELRAEDLPNEDVWDAALRRAEEVGIVPASSLRSAVSVADLNDRILNELISNRADPVRALPAALVRLNAVVALDPDSARLVTARSAVSLVDELNRRRDQAVVVFAEHPEPPNAAVLGTSIKQAVAVVAELERFNVELVRSAIGLGGVHAMEAADIGRRFVEAVEADELTIGLVDRLRSIQSSATSLLARVASEAQASVPPVPPVETPPPVGPTPSPALPLNDERTAARLRAEEQLAAIRGRLKAEANLALEWTIEDAT